MEALPTSVEDDVAAVVADTAARITAVLARQDSAAVASSTPTQAGGEQFGVSGGSSPTRVGGQEAADGDALGLASLPDPVRVEVERFQRRMAALAVTKVHQAASATT